MPFLGADLQALAERYRDAALLLIGKLGKDGGTTSRLHRPEVDHLLSAVPSALDWFDRPPLEQAALLEASDLLISPPT